MSFPRVLLELPGGALRDADAPVDDLNPDVAALLAGYLTALLARLVARSGADPEYAILRATETIRAVTRTTAQQQRAEALRMNPVSMATMKAVLEAEWSRTRPGPWRDEIVGAIAELEGLPAADVAARLSAEVEDED